MKIVFDTYAWIEYFNGTKKGHIVEKYLNENNVLTPSMVLLELSYKADKEKWDFKKFFSFIKGHSQITGLNENFILSFGGIYNKIKKQIKDIGMADVVVLQTAIINEAKILTGDKHFNKIDSAIML
ncbi:MAG: PIN domain-containing protein [Nanoarchaeota archaeon]